MKRYALILCSAIVAIVAGAQQAVTITDFCYKHQDASTVILETYSQSDIISNLRNKGFVIVKQERLNGVGAGNAATTFTKVTMQRKGANGKCTTVVIDEYPIHITFGTLKEANAFVKGAIDLGWFKREGGYITSRLESLFGVNAFQQKSKYIIFSCSVP